MKDTKSKEQWSVIRGFFTEAVSINDFNEAKSFIIEKIREATIYESSKKKMLYNLQYVIQDKQSLHRYLFNSLLAFEGHALIK